MTVHLELETQLAEQICELVNKFAQSGLSNPNIEGGLVLSTIADALGKAMVVLILLGADDEANKALTGNDDPLKWNKITQSSRARALLAVAGSSYMNTNPPEGESMFSRELDLLPLLKGHIDDAIAFAESIAKSAAEATTKNEESINVVDQA